jgi:hypothetical protein
VSVGTISTYCRQAEVRLTPPEQSTILPRSARVDDMRLTAAYDSWGGKAPTPFRLSRASSSRSCSKPVLGFLRTICGPRSPKHHLTSANARIQTLTRKVSAGVRRRPKTDYCGPDLRRCLSPVVISDHGFSKSPGQNRATGCLSFEVSQRPNDRTRSAESAATEAETTSGSPTPVSALLGIKEPMAFGPAAKSWFR